MHRLWLLQQEEYLLLVCFYFLTFIFYQRYTPFDSAPPLLPPPSRSGLPPPRLSFVLLRYFGMRSSCDYGLVCIFDKSADDRRLCRNVKLASGFS